MLFSISLTISQQRQCRNVTSKKLQVRSCLRYDMRLSNSSEEKLYPRHKCAPSKKKKMKRKSLQEENWEESLNFHNVNPFFLPSVLFQKKTEKVVWTITFSIKLFKNNLHIINPFLMVTCLKNSGILLILHDDIFYRMFYGSLTGWAVPSRCEGTHPVFSVLIQASIKSLMDHL